MHRSTRPSRPTRSGRSGPPAWFVFVVGVALVFGLFYLWQGLQTFFRTGGLGVVEATQRAQVVSTATSERSTRVQLSGINDVTPRPTNTPVPECQDFVVSVPNAIVRDAPASGGAIVTSLNEGESVCVLGLEPETEWYVIDQTPGTRRLDLAYMHETVIRAVNPTVTPSRTPSPLPTVTEAPTDTPTISPTPRPTQPPRTPDPQITDTPEPTLTPSATPLRQSV